jgi:acetylornithine/succinyldiaminopimelate/putrescine aminotransferase
MTMTETAAPHRLSDTLSQMLRDRLPNLFRLYLNPFVAQTCYCLDRYVRTTWPSGEGRVTARFPSFLANSFDEAVGGGIKLARYCASLARKPTEGLVLDFENRLGAFANVDLSDGGRIDFIPGLHAIRNRDASACIDHQYGFIALVCEPTEHWARQIQALMARDGTLLIACVNRDILAAVRQGQLPILARLLPDIVVFDESFVNREVPFGAFAARGALCDHWKGAGRANFHSTTYQPNTVSSLQFVRCLEEADPQFFAGIGADLRRIEHDFEFRTAVFRRLYSTSLSKAIRQTGCDTPDVQAEGDFVIVNHRPIFDGVSGVACSVRGHNPKNYLDELDSRPWMQDPAATLSDRLLDLTGLPHLLPAVSGATAVENALKLGLVAQYPRRHVLALHSGFGGKTLLSLTATWKSFYKEHVGPLYSDVTYVDPFAHDAVAQIDRAFEQNPIALVQAELIQGVGGVRAIREDVLRHLADSRARHGHFLLVDEVQTGMYRTGPFARSIAMSLKPDLLTIGKGSSDMMFPFALTLCSGDVVNKVKRSAPGLIDDIRRRFGYEQGYHTVLNVLDQAERIELDKRVIENAQLIARTLRDALASCRAVRDVRVFGMLIGIELDDSRLPQRWFRKRLFWFYLSAMLRHPQFPVLVGFCQYEPNVLKITPPLNADPENLRKACQTIAQILNTPFPKLAAGVAKNLLCPPRIQRRVK